MASILDYLDWRGDLTLEVSPFNEVDNLILSELSYIDYAEVVPGPELPWGITVADAASCYFAKYGEAGPPMGTGLPKELPLLLKKAAGSARFGVAKLSGYVNRIDEAEQKQFSAVTILLDDGVRFIAFRGTDDTLVGWKEDFNMSFRSPVPSQTDAAAYLTEIACACEGSLRVGGHSKGGNLAVFAAASAEPEIQDRIVAVYNNDGPGFAEDFFPRKAYLRIRPRVATILPQSSVVGMLLEHEEHYEVVRSKQIGFMQHNGFTWDVLGTSFIHLDTLSGHTRIFDRSLKDWLSGIDIAQRELFVDTMFSVLEATTAKTLTDLSKNRIQRMTAILRTMRNLDKGTQDVLNKTLLGLFTVSGQVIAKAIAERSPWLGETKPRV